MLQMGKVPWKKLYQKELHLKKFHLEKCTILRKISCKKKYPHVHGSVKVLKSKKTNNKSQKKFQDNFDRKNYEKSHAKQIEAIAIIGRLLDNEWIITQRLVRIDVCSKSVIARVFRNR